MIKIDAGEIDARRIGWRDGAGFVPTDTPASDMNNEAAERLRDEIEQLRSAGLTYQDVGLDLDEALAAERKATVEQYEPILRALVAVLDQRPMDANLTQQGQEALQQARAILDAEVLDT